MYTAPQISSCTSATHSISEPINKLDIYLVGRFVLRCSEGTGQENGQSQKEEKTKHFHDAYKKQICQNSENKMVSVKS